MITALDAIVRNDRYPLSPRIRTLRELSQAATGAAPAGTTAAAQGSTPRRPSAGTGGVTEMKPYHHGPPLTLGGAAAARVRLVVWCRDCQHQVEPDPAEMAERHDAETTVPDWRRRLVCGNCCSKQIDFVATAARR